MGWAMAEYKSETEQQANGCQKTWTIHHVKSMRHNSMTTSTILDWIMFAYVWTKCCALFGLIIWMLVWTAFEWTTNDFIDIAIKKPIFPYEKQRNLHKTYKNLMKTNTNQLYPSKKQYFLKRNTETSTKHIKT